MAMNKKRILIVDDEAPFARLLKLNLEKTDQYEVRVEIWPEDAVSAAREFKPHLMFLDILMPRMPGGNVAAAFKADPELKDIPIVWITAAIRPSQIAESGGKICDYPCLAKPPNLDDILKCIETYARAD
jgi:CheY-like chemotaxis protein